MSPSNFERELSELVNHAQNRLQHLISPSEDYKRGAEAYLQSYEYVVWNNPGYSPRGARRWATVYLRMTASPPLTRESWKGARFMRRTLKKMTK